MLINQEEKKGKSYSNYPLLVKNLEANQEPWFDMILTQTGIIIKQGHFVLTTMNEVDSDMTSEMQLIPSKTISPADIPLYNWEFN